MSWEVWLTDDKKTERCKYRYDACATGVEVFGESAKENKSTSTRTRIRALSVFTRSGMQRIAGKQFIDCTGDAFLAQWSGATTTVYAPGKSGGAWQGHYLNNRELRNDVRGKLLEKQEVMTLRVDGLEDSFYMTDTVKIYDKLNNKPNNTPEHYADLSRKRLVRMAIWLSKTGGGKRVLLRIRIRLEL